MDKNLKRQLETFVNPVKEGSIEENMLYELLLKSGVDLNCKIEKIPSRLSRRSVAKAEEGWIPACRETGCVIISSTKMNWLLHYQKLMRIL